MGKDRERKNDDRKDADDESEEEDKEDKEGQREDENEREAGGEEEGREERGKTRWRQKMMMMRMTTASAVTAAEDEADGAFSCSVSARISASCARAVPMAFSQSGMLLGPALFMPSSYASALVSAVMRSRYDAKREGATR